MDLSDDPIDPRPAHWAWVPGPMIPRARRRRPAWRLVGRVANVLGRWNGAGPDGALLMSNNKSLNAGNATNASKAAADGSPERGSVLDLPLNAVMREEIGLPLEHVPRLYTVGSLPNAWGNRRNQRSIAPGVDSA